MMVQAFPATACGGIAGHKPLSFTISAAAGKRRAASGYGCTGRRRVLTTSVPTARPSALPATWS